MRSRCLLLSVILVVGACDKKAETVLEIPPANTKDPRLKGGMGGTSPRANPGSEPLTANDAPYVHGKIVIVGPRKEERLAAGFVGMGADGKQHSNMAGTTFGVDQGGYATSLTFQPQITGVNADDQGSITYRHTHVPPGDYLVYVQRNKVLAAWQKVTVKAGDQLSVDLTIDPSKTGEVVVTLPDAEAEDKAEWRLSMRPAGLDVPGTESSFAFDVAEVKSGQKEVKVSGVPAGKYSVKRGKSTGEVEVVAGKSTAVTLVRDEPKKK